MGDLKKTKKIFLYALIISVVCSALYYYINLLATVVFCILSIFSMYFFTKKVSLSIVLPICTLLIYISTDYLSAFIIGYFFNLKETMIVMNLVRLTISFIPFLVVAKYTYSYLKKKRIPKKVIQIGIVISTTTMFLFFSILLIDRFVEQGTTLGTAHSIFIFAYGLISALIFQVLLFSFEKESKIKEKQKELRQLHLYISELEKNYTEMRRFRHDYKNILLSIESYIESKDLDGLSEYFHTNIQQVSSTMLENDFTLAKLSNIEIKAVKSLLANKLIIAQELGIDTNIEIYDKIEKTTIGDLTLVRSLGIILDNAIEASSELENSILRIGIFLEDDSLNIIVANSCDKDIPPLFQLKKEGYSTKGKDRGLGLSTLEHIVAKEKHLTLDTKINKRLFIQILSIEE
ncbi:sensor histidine kinase [Enterococcus durans]|uniref:sensor histidine kinase n=1 Tax=Enterococcus durans TaxID=53345 RepID=UPI000F4FBAF7|nr:GHKL domain-containing protein [Enterococcus durans]